MAEKFVDINGIKICYQMQGDGYPVVLIHGFGSKKESFMAQIPVLSQEFKIISFDNRGAGKSERPDMPYSMEMFVDDIKGLMDYLGISTAHLLGLSLGGMIGLNFILKNPRRVNKLVLINTLAQLPDDFDPESYVNSKIKALELAKKDPELSFWQSTQFGFYHKFRNKMKANPKEKFYGLWSVEDVLKYYKTDRPTAQDVRNIASSFKTNNVYEKLSEINHKTLLLTASHDRLVPKEKMLEIHKKMPNSTYHLIEEAGHESPKEKAPEVNRAIIKFLKS
ncbi:MAG: alpha/beta hydrolase [Candidatus Lokiarchaeota archaeon]|nr:alpha/beta hydrolase [Candidatus Lokiarchaeota archaeon]